MGEAGPPRSVLRTTDSTRALLNRKFARINFGSRGKNSGPPGSSRGLLGETACTLEDDV